MHQSTLPFIISYMAIVASACSHAFKSACVHRQSTFEASLRAFIISTELLYVLIFSRFLMIIMLASM